MKLLIDMNLSPDWSPKLEREGWEVIHWSSVGDPTAPDQELMDYARKNGCVVITHDLDFSAMLAATQAQTPSIIQVRTQDVMSDRFLNILVDTLNQFQAQLERGALVVVDEFRARARILPLR